jgi:hypothetical protein
MSRSSVDEIQRTNWGGSIPTVITLAPTSLSTPTAPPPIHILLSRQTFLHLGLATVIRRLHPFAPTALSFQSSAHMIRREEPEPGEGSEDETDGPLQETQTAQTVAQQPKKDTDDKESFPVCWWEDEETKTPLRWHLWAGVLYDLQGRKPGDLPWRLRLHFTNYPSATILPLSEGQVQRQVRAVFQNSLKQAVTLRTGQARSALQLLTKESHETLWQAIQQVQNNAHLYRQVSIDLQPKLNSREAQTRIPVRLFVDNSLPVIQKSCLVSQDVSLGNLLRLWLPNIQLPGEELPASEGTPTTVYGWKVNGIQPPLETLVLDLWEHLCQADFFLYIIVLTTKK